MNNFTVTIFWVNQKGETQGGDNDFSAKWTFHPLYGNIPHLSSAGLEQMIANTSSSSFSCSF